MPTSSAPRPTEVNTAAARTPPRPSTRDDDASAADRLTAPPLRRRLRQRAWLVVPIAVASMLWVALPRPGVWLDEAATVSATVRSGPELVRLLHHQDAALAGYYGLVWAAARLTHLDALTTARLASGAAYVIGTLCVTLVGRRLGTRRTGLLAGLAFALLPSTSASAVNARPEALATMLVAAALLAALAGRRVMQYLLGMAACAVYALTVLYLPVIALAVWAVHRRDAGGVVTPREANPRQEEPAHAAADAPGTASVTSSDAEDVGATSPAFRGGAQRVLLAWPAAVATLAGGLWLLVCSRQQRQVSWIHTSVRGDLLASFTRVGFTAPLSRMHEQPALACSMALAVIACLLAVALVLRGRRSAQNTSLDAGAGRDSWNTPPRTLPAALWAAAVVPPLVATGAVAAGHDIFVERYFTPSSVGIALVIALAIERWPVRRMIPAAVVWVVLLTPVLVSSHRADGHWGENLGAHSATLADAAPGRTWFVAPRNRAALFVDGHLDAVWAGQPWWRDAREQGTLWGDDQARPAMTPGDWVVVTDTRRVSRLTLPASCRRLRTVSEARATSIVVRCLAR